MAADPARRGHIRAGAGAGSTSLGAANAGEGLRFHAPINQTEWLSIRVTHCVDDAGYTTKVELDSGDVSRSENIDVEDCGPDSP